MVVSAHRLASEAGAAILREGGNAVDAAVAVGYALAVVDPCCGNIGGGGFMVLRLANGTEAALDFRETAPASATATMYVGSDGRAVPDASLLGWRAVGVPGTVAGLDHALEHWGTVSRQAAMAPAIRLARDGFALTRFDTDIAGAAAKKLQADPEAARIFLGDRSHLAQPDLAATLSAIAARGPDAFYRGPVAHAIAAGGSVSEADLSGYAVRERPPLHCAYRGLDLVVMPPPSSGGVAVCELLGVLQRHDLAAMGWHGAAEVHVMAEAMRHVFFDRNTYLGDPDYVANPLDWLLSAAHLDGIAAATGPRATPTATLRPGVVPHEQAETTSFAVVDAAGDAVAVTYTLNGAFGAGVVAPGTGVLLNDEMDDFATVPGAANAYGLIQGARNAIAPGKRPLSSMSPTIVLRDGRLAMVVGSPGGSRIITAVAQAIIDMADHGMAPQEAVDAPRLHMQGIPDKLFMEPRALSPDTQAVLRDMGYDIAEQAPWGAVELIATSLVGTPRPAASPGNDAALSGAMRPGYVYGASDSRRPAGAASAP